MTLHILMVNFITLVSSLQTLHQLLFLFCELPQTNASVAAILAPHVDLTGKCRGDGGGGGRKGVSCRWRLSRWQWWSAQSESSRSQHWGSAGVETSAFHPPVVSDLCFSFIFYWCNCLGLDGWWDGALSTIWSLPMLVCLFFCLF